MKNTKDFTKKSCGKFLLQSLPKIYVYIRINRVKMELLYNGPWCPYRLKNKIISPKNGLLLFGIVRPMNSTGYCWCYLVTLQNFMVRPCCWRHHIPTWVAEHGKIMLVLTWEVLFMLLKEKNICQSYPDMSPVSHNNNWRVILTHWQKSAMSIMEPLSDWI